MVRYPYFETVEPLTIDSGASQTYTDGDASGMTNTKTAEWNHGLGEIVQAVLDAGLTLTMLEEHDSIPWDAFPGQMTRIGGGEFRLTDRPERLPHSYTLQARRHSEAPAW